MDCIRSCDIAGPDRSTQLRFCFASPPVTPIQPSRVDDSLLKKKFYVTIQSADRSFYPSPNATGHESQRLGCMPLDEQYSCLGWRCNNANITPLFNANEFQVFTAGAWSEGDVKIQGEKKRKSENRARQKHSDGTS